MNVDRGIIGVKFELMQLDEALKMAEMEKDKEIKERKKVTESLEGNKLILFSILQMNASRKDKEAENRLK